jgi:hypothetical protein
LLSGFPPVLAVGVNADTREPLCPKPAHGLAPLSSGDRRLGSPVFVGPPAEDWVRGGYARGGARPAALRAAAVTTGPSPGTSPPSRASTRNVSAAATDADAAVVRRQRTAWREAVMTDRTHWATGCAGSCWSTPASERNLSPRPWSQARLVGRRRIDKGTLRHAPYAFVTLTACARRSSPRLGTLL